MSLWKQAVSIDVLHAIHVDTAVARLGIEFLEVGEDFIRARVPVNTHTRQPYGLLHGGVSVVLAETLGSCGAAFTLPEGYRAVGLDINANHLRGASCAALRSNTTSSPPPARSPSRPPSSWSTSTTWRWPIRPAWPRPAKKSSRTRPRAFKYTSRGNLVAVVTNGTAVLGLGDIGPLAPSR
jgi:uncharacterized protein (TIGR00369 family)